MKKSYIVTKDINSPVVVGSQKQEQENKSKQTKYWIIGGSVLGGLAIIGLIVYLVKKKNA